MKHLQHSPYFIYSQLISFNVSAAGRLHWWSLNQIIVPLFIALPPTTHPPKIHSILLLNSIWRKGKTKSHLFYHQKKKEKSPLRIAWWINTKLSLQSIELPAVWYTPPLSLYLIGPPDSVCLSLCPFPFTSHNQQHLLSSLVLPS